MDNRSLSIMIVPDSVEECELNKEKLQSENDGTLQVYFLYRKLLRKKFLFKILCLVFIKTL